MSLRDDILRHLERRDAIAATPLRCNERVAWLDAAIELLLRAELQRQAQGGEGARDR